MIKTILLLIICLQASVASAFTIATGPSDGSYSQIAQDIKSVAGKENIDIQVMPTKGSLENIQLLGTGKVDMAIVQLDALRFVSDVLKQQHMEPNPNSSLLVSHRETVRRPAKRWPYPLCRYRGAEIFSREPLVGYLNIDVFLPRHALDVLRDLRITSVARPVAIVNAEPLGLRQMIRSRIVFIMWLLLFLYFRAPRRTTTCATRSPIDRITSTSIIQHQS